RAGLLRFSRLVIGSIPTGRRGPQRNAHPSLVSRDPSDIQRGPSHIRRHPAVMDADSPLEYVGRVSQWRVPVEGGFTTISESTSVVNPPPRAGRADRRWVCDTPGAKSVVKPPPDC